MTFKPSKKKKIEKTLFNISIESDLLKLLNQASEEEGMARQTLVRQMIIHCLKEMGVMGSHSFK